MSNDDQFEPVGELQEAIAVSPLTVMLDFNQLHAIHHDEAFEIVAKLPRRPGVNAIGITAVTVMMVAYGAIAAAAIWADRPQVMWDDRRGAWRSVRRMQHEQRLPTDC